MKGRSFALKRGLAAALLAMGPVLFLGGCGKKVEQEALANTAPPPAVVEPDVDADNVRVDHPEQFPLVPAVAHFAAEEMHVTGVVAADPSRQVTVPALASGRIAEIDARLGDEVKKGQLLFKIRSTDITSAYADYQKAVRNEGYAKAQLARKKILYDGGSASKTELETAENAEENARVDVDSTLKRLRVLGAADPENPTDIVPVYATADGVITDQQITEQSGVQALTAPNPFTISDLSHVWIICDVYENNLSKVQMDEFADVRLNAYPDRVFRGRISNISPILDPNLRTAKVRLQVDNPGIMRLGMFVTATFHGEQGQQETAVPAAAVLHLHDRDWVYTAAAQPGRFRRVEVSSGDNLPGGLVEIRNGLKTGDRVVSNALVLQSTVEQ
jgi:cobalt-zinc-cadmium efflux system membrane fusion protein